METTDVIEEDGERAEIGVRASNETLRTGITCRQFDDPELVSCRTFKCVEGRKCGVSEI